MEEQQNNTVNDLLESITSFGSTLFPMLYFYARHKNLITEYTKNKYLYDIKQFNNENIQLNSKDIESLYNSAATTIYMKMTSAAKKNPSWIWSLNNTVSSIMERYKVRLPQVKGALYTNKRGEVSYTPILDQGDPNNFENILECLRLLYENDIIVYNYDLGIRDIDINTGNYNSIRGSETNAKDHSIHKPIVGQFVLNNNNIKPAYGRTFTGTDMKVLVSLGNTVTPIKNMTTFTWSVHRGKGVGRPVGRPGSLGRSKGPRTIAGTMIFAVTDHEPLLDIIPSTAPTRRLDRTGWNQKGYRSVIMPDDLPPFDITVVMGNEYGAYAILTVYGIEIIDYGGQYNVDNLMNEHVYQYTAAGMDPIVEAYPDENGFIDPYGVLQGGYSEMWFRREAAMHGLLYSDLEQAYFDHLYSIYNKTRRRKTDNINKDKNSYYEYRENQ